MRLRSSVMVEHQSGETRLWGMHDFRIQREAVEVGAAGIRPDAEWVEDDPLLRLVLVLGDTNCGGVEAAPPGVVHYEAPDVVTGRRGVRPNQRLWSVALRRTSPRPLVGHLGSSMSAGTRGELQEWHRQGMSDHAPAEVRMAISGMQPVTQRPLARGVLADPRLGPLLQGAVRLWRMDTWGTSMIRGGVRFPRGSERGSRDTRPPAWQARMAQVGAAHRHRPGGCTAEVSGGTAVVRASRGRTALVVDPGRACRLAFRTRTGSQRRCARSARKTLPGRSQREGRVRAEHDG